MKNMLISDLQIYKVVMLCGLFSKTPLLFLVHGHIPFLL